MNFNDTTIDEIKSVFKAGFRILENRNVSPFSKNDTVLLTCHSDFITMYLESKNIVNYSNDGRFTIQVPSVSEASMNFGYDENGNIDYLNFDAKGKVFNSLAAIEELKEIGVSFSDNYR